MKQTKQHAITKQEGEREREGRWEREKREERRGRKEGREGSVCAFVSCTLPVTPKLAFSRAGSLSVFSLCLCAEKEGKGRQTEELLPPVIHCP